MIVSGMVPIFYPLMLGDVPFDTYLHWLKGLDVPVMAPGFPIKDTRPSPTKQSQANDRYS